MTRDFSGGRFSAAIAGILGAEFDPADRRTRGLAKAGIECVAGFRRDAHPQQDGDNRQSLPLSPEQHRGPRFLVGTTFRTKDLRRR